MPSASGEFLKRGTFVKNNDTAGRLGLKDPNTLSERIATGMGEPRLELLPIELREYVSARCGARGFSTGSMMIPPFGQVPYYRRNYSHAITILRGEACVGVEGRRYRMRTLDCIHIPAGVAHHLSNPSAEPVLLHWASASSQPKADLVENGFRTQERTFANSEPGDPEYIARFAQAQAYELAPGTQFYDLFAGRFGAHGICGGYGEFVSGSSLPCHFHEYDESITIVSGQATCEVKGSRYHPLSNCDTAFVPLHRPHRFLNESGGRMAMIWVYAGDEPDRTIVDVGYCTGALAWNDGT
jgi:quercetin dioxygenase-like cupin family protein